MSKSVLVIDNNRNYLILARDLLEVGGFEVSEAENAADGIAMVKRKKPDIILMDVRLPDMRGTEVARILRQDKETSDLPIVFVTSSSMTECEEEIKDISGTGFIGKPVNTRTFVKGIKQFIK